MKKIRYCVITCCGEIILSNASRKEVADTLPIPISSICKYADTNKLYRKKYRISRLVPQPEKALKVSAAEKFGSLAKQWDATMERFRESGVDFSKIPIRKVEESKV